MERRAVTVRGIVQGVGFRPHVYRLAQECSLSGSVRNESGAVCIEIEGDRGSLDRFCHELADRPPPLAVIDEMSCRVMSNRGDVGFRIVQSAARHSQDVLVSPDVATCADCLRELFDPADRRYRYPFLNCTNCGPRLTIVRGAPYDRELTTMASFAMCAQCRAEYEDPSDRRYHAQPTCCPRCGPRLRLCTPGRGSIAGADPIVAFALALRGGKIGALKGLGGYHLVCDASSAAATALLRKRKGRDDKPFALMVANVAQARLLCEVDDQERELLEAAGRPIVLLRRRKRSNDSGSGDSRIAEAVAPGNPYLGLMLPYTPLHHLLMDAVGGMALVMTSGNRTDEPIAYEDDAAFEQLGEIADVFLVHDRPIHIRCDDSVTRVVGERETPVRRSRGYAPRPIELPFACPRPLLAVGGQLKCTFALGRGRAAILSHHLGDLDDLRAFRAFERDIRLYAQLFDTTPQLLVHDLHPDYASTAYARRRAASEVLDTLAVQHHHAHVAACMAEYRLQGEVIGVAWDGTGLGTDGAIWGGEFLIASYADFRRAAHLRYVPLPGGDRAVRQTWRVAASHLLDAGCDVEGLEQAAPKAELRTVCQMIERGVNSPMTSSAGRLFDAVAALAGIRASVSFEGQAAMELEALATDDRSDGSYPFALDRSRVAASAVEIDTRPLVRAVFDDARRGTNQRRRIARRFQATLVKMIAAVCDRIRRDTGLARIVLSGGVFLNVLLAQEASERLSADGFEVFRHHLVPPGDGGISLGQVAVAAALCQRSEPTRGSLGNDLEKGDTSCALASREK